MSAVLSNQVRKYIIFLLLLFGKNRWKNCVLLGEAKKIFFLLSVKAGGSQPIQKILIRKYSDFFYHSWPFFDYWFTWALLSIPTNNFLSSPRPSPSIAIFSVSNKKHHVLPLPGRSSPIVKTTWLCDLKCDLVPNLTLLVSPEKKCLRVEVISSN